jgi:GMP reductase
MSTTGTFSMADALQECKMLTAIHKFYPVEDLVRFFKSKYTSNFCFYTLGIREEEFEKLDSFAKELTPDKICLDVANGYSRYFVDKLKRVRERFPKAILMAGNVATAEMTQELILAGADIVKVGIGPGSACVTRIKTGVGYPQLSAIAECADAAHGLGGLICGDGGCTTPGDIAKAMGAGADLVMLGGMLAGTTECSGRRSSGGFEFYGMASETAQNKYYSGVKGYAAAEGKTVVIPERGPVKPILREIKGGLRSACSYVGASKLKDLSKCTTFVRVSRTHNQIFGG